MLETTIIRCDSKNNYIKKKTKISNYLNPTLIFILGVDKKQKILNFVQRG